MTIRSAAAAFTDPALTPQTGSLSIIVTAANSSVAAQTIQAVGGTVTSDLWLINAVGATIPAEALDQLAHIPTVLSVVANNQITTSAARAKHNQPHTDLGWPVAEDVGAEQLHEQGITGAGVTVAVVDSGVTFYKKLVDGTDAAVVLDYAGQFDFSEDSSCSKQIGGYCFQKSKDARDPYGHGSHVAGIIGNGYQDAASGVYLGIAPDAEILSFRALTDEGVGSYEQTIQALQAVAALQEKYDIRIVNLSLSATASVPYFVDPLNRAVEALWARGIVVIAAAGNEGPSAGSITTPGNDPYVITVGGINTRRTPGHFGDDMLPTWSATGPTADGFVKPDVLAPGSGLVSFMYNAESDPQTSAFLARSHPNYSLNSDLFSMSGTSMATAVTSGVVALMLQANPDLTPDQVKFRLMTSAQPAIDGTDLAYNLFQQGAGRIWAPTAALGDFPADAAANTNMDIAQDLAHGSADSIDLAFHYQGPIQRHTAEDGVTLYYATGTDDVQYALGVATPDGTWLSSADAAPRLASFATTLGVGDPVLAWAGGASPSAGADVWSEGGYAWSGGGYAWSGGGYAWSGGGYAWSGGGYAWSGGGYAWSGGGYAWSGGGYAWSGGGYAWSGGGYAWAGTLAAEAQISATRWVADGVGAEEMANDPVGQGPIAVPVPGEEEAAHHTFLPAVFTEP